ncbi:unnamed protein product [Hymenolepis diminuta]|uniref:DUF5727 domain-containing protein n=1 Tax=Hymenolepis diminuta TaxID=6216 RepID=A0A564Z9X0_HYMDI|nr:unnamed protein product [Hymenolepis diminuta]
MYFRSIDPLQLDLYQTQSIERKYVDIVDGNCTVNGRIVGSPCEWNKDNTVVTFNEVANYDLLVFFNYRQMYTVYFAEGCKFPSSQDGDIIVEKSMPLYRFLGGETEENVVFAMKGNDFKEIELNKDINLMCEWKELVKYSGECDSLIVDKVSGQVMYNATISKRAEINYGEFRLIADSKFTPIVKKQFPNQLVVMKWFVSLNLNM